MRRRQKGGILGILDWPLAFDPLFWIGLFVAYLATFDPSGRQLTHPALGAELLALVVIGLGAIRLAVRHVVRALDRQARDRRDRRLPHGALSPVLWTHRATGLRGAAEGPTSVFAVNARGPVTSRGGRPVTATRTLTTGT